MNYIGSVIRELREQKGLSRPQLSAHICSVKYLYFIEKGDRTPSSEITRLLGMRLGVDLFTYFEFLDCKNPIAVHDAVVQFNIYRNISDFAAAKMLSDQARELPDFQTPPWKYEIAVNDAAYMLFLERRFQDSIDYVLPILESINPKYAEHDFVVNFLVILSSCYMEFKDFEKACNTMARAEEIISNKEGFARYNSLTITVKLNKMSYHNYTGDYDGAIEQGLQINQLQFRTNSSERANFTYYYLAYAYYKKEMFDEALDWFEKCLFDLILRPSDVAGYFISTYEHFYDLLYHPSTNSILAKKIIAHYRLPEET